MIRCVAIVVGIIVRTPTQQIPSVLTKSVIISAAIMKFPQTFFPLCKNDIHHLPRKVLLPQSRDTKTWNIINDLYCAESQRKSSLRSSVKPLFAVFVHVTKMKALNVHASLVRKGLSGCIYQTCVRNAVHESKCMAWIVVCISACNIAPSLNEYYSTLIKRSHYSRPSYRVVDKREQRKKNKNKNKRSCTIWRDIRIHISTCI